MILGVGADVICIKRFKESLKKTPAIVERVFTPEERKCATRLSALRKATHYAKRFAAKEAISKACGTGIGTDIGWQDICILNNEKGAPFAVLSKKTHRFLRKKFKAKTVRIFLSLTDEKEYAMAFALLDK